MENIIAEFVAIDTVNTINWTVLIIQGCKPVCMYKRGLHDYYDVITVSLVETFQVCASQTVCC